MQEGRKYFKIRLILELFSRDCVIMTPHVKFKFNVEDAEGKEEAL